MAWRKTTVTVWPKPRCQNRRGWVHRHRHILRPLTEAARRCRRRPTMAGATSNLGSCQPRGQMGSCENYREAHPWVERGWIGRHLDAASPGLCLTGSWHQQSHSYPWLRLQKPRADSNAFIMSEGTALERHCARAQGDGGPRPLEKIQIVPRHGGQHILLVRYGPPAALACRFCACSV